MGFDDFEALVHEGCGVHGNFAAHVPGGVSKDLVFCNLCELVAGFSSEWAAGCRENELVDLIRLVALKALEESGVFGIYGGEGDAFFGYERHNNLSGGNEDFFAGEGDIFFGVDGGEGWFETNDSGDGDDDEINLGVGSDVDDGLDSAGEKVFSGGFFVHESDVLGVEFFCLGDEFGRRTVGDEAGDAEFIGVLADNIEGLGSD